MIIGITGMIGSGKSTAARILKSLGAEVIDADQIGREVVEDDPRVLHRLARQFGDGILTRSGKLDRAALASLAFADESSRKQLNTIVHPPLLRRLKSEMKQLSKKHDLLVVDAALLLDWCLDRLVDVVVVIHAAQPTRLARLKKRGIDRRDALARQRRQLPYAIYRKKADFVVFNRGTERQLETKLRDILKSVGFGVDF
jgi:dephospho-CoA kinase